MSTNFFHTSVHTITRFGELAVLLPLSTMLFAVLWGCESKQAAVAFLRALAACLFAMAVLKLFFLSCRVGTNAGMVGPSGHAAASTMVLGSLAVVVCSRIAGTWRIAAALAVIAMVAAIATSRVMVGVHSISEVVVGTLVGFFTLFWFFRTYRRLEHPPLNVALLSVAAIAMLVLLNGAHLPVETILRKWSRLIRMQTNICKPFGGTHSAIEHLFWP